MPYNRANYVDLVKAFHKAFNHDAPDAPVDRVRVTVSQLRVRLIAEECNEVVSVLTQKDVNTADLAKELSDLIYVVAGTAVSAGLALTYPEPMMHLFGDDSGPFLTLELVADLVMDSLLLCQCIHTQPCTRWGAALSRLILTCEEIAIRYDIPLRQCFEAVHESNMSKLGPDGKPVYYTDGPFKGKVMKGPNYKKPDLVPIIAAWNAEPDSDRMEPIEEKADVRD